MEPTSLRLADFIHMGDNDKRPSLTKDTRTHF
jgi:hypothetical protein